MARAPRFTVLIPTHNRADVVGYAIRSVLAQTLDDFELIVAGDGCTDDTAAVVSAFDDARLRWLDLPKTPAFGYANRNVALRTARGELVAYLAHDDLWFPDHLEVLLAAFQDRHVQLAYSHLLLVSPGGVIAPRIVNLDDSRTLGRLMKRRVGLGISCVAHRRSCLEEYGWWDESRVRGGDTELWGRFITRAGKHSFVYVPVPTALHFVASWRRQSWRHRARLWAYQLERSVPTELRLHVPAGVPEQKVVWDALESGPERVAELRRAVQLQLDRMALARYPSTLLQFVDQQVQKLFD